METVKVIRPYQNARPASEELPTEDGTYFDYYYLQMTCRRTRSTPQGAQASSRRSPSECCRPRVETPWLGTPLREEGRLFPTASS